MWHRIHLFLWVALCAVLVSIGFAGDNKNGERGISPKLLERVRSEEQFDVSLPSQSACLLSELLAKHCKSDKVTMAVKEEKDGSTTLTIRGEQDHVAAVCMFTSLLTGELPTAEDRVKQLIECDRVGTKDLFAPRPPKVSVSESSSRD